MKFENIGTKTKTPHNIETKSVFLPKIKDQPYGKKHLWYSNINFYIETIK